MILVGHFQLKFSNSIIPFHSIPKFRCQRCSSGASPGSSQSFHRITDTGVSLALCRRIVSVLSPSLLREAAQDSRQAALCSSQGVQVHRTSLELSQPARPGSFAVQPHQGLALPHGTTPTHLVFVGAGYSMPAPRLGSGTRGALQLHENWAVGMLSEYTSAGMGQGGQAPLPAAAGSPDSERSGLLALVENAAVLRGRAEGVVPTAHSPGRGESSPVYTNV